MLVQSRREMFPMTRFIISAIISLHDSKVEFVWNNDHSSFVYLGQPLKNLDENVKNVKNGMQRGDYRIYTRFL